MRVLGVDPGLTRCGLGVIEGEPGRPLRLVATDVVRTPPGDGIGARLLALEAELEVWLDRHVPEAVAVERVFSQHNVRTVMGTAQAGAVAIVCAARRGIPVALHTPSEVKAAVTGSGRADKQQVTEMVTRLLRLPERPRPADCADALALAICHLWRGTAQERLAAAQRTTAQRTTVQRTTRQPTTRQPTTGQPTTGQTTVRPVSAAPAPAVPAPAAPAPAARGTPGGPLPGVSLTAALASRPAVSIRRPAGGSR